MGYSPWGRTELDMTKRTEHTQLSFSCLFPKLAQGNRKNFFSLSEIFPGLKAENATRPEVKRIPILANS